MTVAQLDPQAGAFATEVVDTIDAINSRLGA